MKSLLWTISLIAIFITALPTDTMAKRVEEKLPIGSFKTLDLSTFNATVEKVQSALKDAGFYNGSVDGRFNQDTEKAILEYRF